MKVIITEDQIRRVVKTIVSEQTRVVSSVTTKTEDKVFPAQNLGDKFAYGQIDSPQVKSSIEGLKPQIDNFIKSSDYRSFVLTITAGESRVTNPKGYEVKGSLAMARANTVKKYFEQLYPNLIQNGTLKIVAPTSVNQVKIGETPYGGAGSGDNTNPEKMKLYNQEQFVSFTIAGTGSKTTKTESYKYLCGQEAFKAEGGVLPFEKDYTQITENKLGSGEGKIGFSIDAVNMPDIIYFEYNGKTYGSSLFRGLDNDSHRILIGTALRIKYGLNLPAHMAGNTIEPLACDIKNKNVDGRLYSALMDTTDQFRIHAWKLGDSFNHIYGPGSPLDNDAVMQAFFEYDTTQRPGFLLRTLGPDFPWGYLSSKMLPSYEKNAVAIDKIDGVDTIKIINVAPNGNTKWRIYLNCY